MILLLFVVATIVVIVALLRVRDWAPLAVYVLEGLAVLLAPTRIARRPGAAVLSLVLSVAIVSLVAAGSRPARSSPAP